MYSGCSPLTVTFTDQSTGNPKFWNWDFGNGHLDTTFAPGNLNYTYNTGSTTDTFTIQMIAVNECGVDTQRLDIRVAPNIIVPLININGSDLFVGGQFTTGNVGGTTVATSNVAKVNVATGQWSALGAGGGNGLNGSGVSALLAKDGVLYVGGGFTTANVGGTTVAANNIARFDIATNTWSALGTGGGNGVNFGVFALAMSGSDLYLGGAFTQANVGGTTVSVNRLAKFNTLSNTWATLGVGGGNGVSNTVNALLLNGSDLYVGGIFTTANVGGATVAANRVVRVNTSTGQWAPLADVGGGNGADNQVLALAKSDEALFMGGAFTIVGDNKSASRFAKYCLGASNTAPIITTNLPFTARGDGGSIFNIADVTDAETPAGNLVVTVTSAPAGITITNITNTNGAINAPVLTPLTISSTGR